MSSNSSSAKFFYVVLLGWIPLMTILAQPAASRPSPLMVAPLEALKTQIPKSLHATRPDYVVFVPQVTDTGVSDTGNEHFHVFDGPDGSLMAVWTQSTSEGQSDQHIVFAQSTDEGQTWSQPRLIAGPAKPGQGQMASWQLPLVSKSGRIYVLYSQHIGKFDTFPHTTGRMDGIYSDDRGKTWSTPQTAAMPRSPRDNPDPSFPGNWIVWQKPLRLAEDNRYLAGFTRWTSTAVKKNPTPSWISLDARVEFMRFDNVDENPEVADLKITWIASGTNALHVPFPGHPEISACQEPSIVKLPDGRLFCVMRTAAGSPYWTQSRDGGETWTAAKPLLRKDNGEVLKHPLSPCPIYDLGGNTAGSGRYALFIHNHDGNYQGYKPADTGLHRRPVYLLAGQYQADAEQPVWFDEPRFFMDHDGVALGPPGQRGRLDLAMYASVTTRNGKTVLWYPDRKFLLLGKVIATNGNLAMPEGSYFPLWDKATSTLTDLALIYQGGKHRPAWTAERLAPYVSYRDSNGGNEQWLFDSFLFIEFQDGKRMTYQPDSRMTPAQKNHWSWLLERNFSEAEGIPLLEKVCRETAARIGPPPRRRQVVITLPVPIPGQTNWGELNGRALDFNQPADRLAACEWYLDAALAKWKELSPQQFDLAGFYWVDETALRTTEFVAQVAQRVRARGQRFYWIPYWQPARPTADWRACGFDVVWQQPNHFFHPEVTDARLQEACDFARRHGMGMEMEFDARMITQPAVFAPRFDAYLDAFTRDGVKETATIAYYEGGGAVHQLAGSDKPEVRRYYDRLAEFILHRQWLADAKAKTDR